MEEEKMLPFDDGADMTASVESGVSELAETAPETPAEPAESAKMDSDDAEIDPLPPDGEAETDAGDGADSDPEIAEDPDGEQRPRSRREVLQEANRRAQEREQRSAARQQFLAGWSGLQSAMRRETVMYGVVSSIDEMPLKDTASEYLHTGIFVTIIHKNTYKIMIPFQHLYRRFPVDMRTVDLDSEAGVRAFILRQRAMAEKLYGLNIPFVIDNMVASRIAPDEDYAISASRAKALEIFERANYEPGPDGHALVEEGSFVNDATVISVADWSMQVNVRGVDTIIPVRNLTYKFISKITDLRDNYRVGDQLVVQVMRIEKGEDGIHNIEVNAKPAELVRAKASPLAVKEGEMTVGTVTSIANSRNRPGQIVISMYLDFYNRPAFSNEFPASRMGFYPQPGDKVRVTVRQVFDSGMIRVACRQTHGAMDLFTR